jgi:hypothetical protein
MSIDIFIRNRLKKDAHREEVTIKGHEVKCSCGTVWFGIERIDLDRCPDCGSPAMPGRIGPYEERKTTVALRFGNLGIAGTVGTATVRSR